MFIKRFINWTFLKERLEAHDYEPPLIKEGDFWWCSVGENMGVEISGRGELFRRPVIVLKKLEVIPSLVFPQQPKNIEDRGISLLNLMRCLRPLFSRKHESLVINVLVKRSVLLIV